MQPELICSLQFEGDGAYGMFVHQRIRSQALEFHISRKAREHFNFDDSLFTLSGDIVFPNFRAVQEFAAKINDQRSSSAKARSQKDLSPIISPGDLNAIGLFHEVLHYVINSYLSEINSAAFSGLENWLCRTIGAPGFQKSIQGFAQLFPSSSVYRREESVNQYLSHSTGNIPNPHVVLMEQILLWIENKNPAFAPVSQLIDDSILEGTSNYSHLVIASEEYFETQPKFSSVDLSLLKMLRAPMQAHPNSITEQLLFIVKNWREILSRSPFLLRLLTAVDIMKEEGKYFMMLAQAKADKSKMPEVRQADFFGFGERESSRVLQFRGHEFESENFSQDLGWMPRLVLIAKSAFVWLDQLSKKYRRSIARLDEIPDVELAILANRGFTGLWLIGIWKRSHASRQIKHLNGNIDAVASAYSLDSYDISPELGGEDAFLNLKNRAKHYGIRLASDMVPNHMGIDSSWVINHPDWFLNVEYPPFPNYSFNGPDLSNDDRVGVFIEDGYWKKTDAAVSFKRLDRWTGSVRYIYHGNDGTHMPWNDTAQLDFTKPEVREAVIQTILHVARKFSIIRFDAAMVLAKKHIQRLWFPEPGTGGAIPSRANHSMTKDQFDALMPYEFWREVVDRVQREVPDTLLLAEAFWLMEGYFVRTLGMHRVYNSAFMNMLKREENANYRQVIKNVLEYNPQILKRFVNFVNNPDEETAVAQFGKDDKYFGACVMMATMPGLPMFGHGQVEGFTEKYGMEYKRAYRDEQPDDNLVARHEREIFPLLRKRQLFSEMDNFLMYDVSTGDGTVNEDVFAYSNRFGEERSLVVFNNRYSHASGWIMNSVGFLGDEGKIIRRQLQDGLQLPDRENDYLIFEDVVNHLEYIRPSKLLRREGLYIELSAFKYNVFMNFRHVQSSGDKPFDELCDFLNGQGINSIDDALYDYKLREVHAAFYEAINVGSLKYLLECVEDRKLTLERTRVFTEKLEKLFSAVSAYEHLPAKKSTEKSGVGRQYVGLVSLPKLLDGIQAPKAKLEDPSSEVSLSGWRVLFLWLFLSETKNFLAREKKVAHPSVDWRLEQQVVNCFRSLGVDEETSRYETELVSELLEADDHGGKVNLRELVVEAAHRESTRRFFKVNVYDGVAWLNKERFEDFIEYLALTVMIKELSRLAKRISSRSRTSLKKIAGSVTEIEDLALKANYRLEDFISALNAD